MDRWCARAAAEVAASAYVFLSRLFGGVEPDIAVIVVGEADWSGSGPYGLPFFRDDAAEIRLTVRTGLFASGIASTQPIASTPARPQRRH
jgi:hypothetical protein